MTELLERAFAQRAVGGSPNWKFYPPLNKMRSLL